MPFHRVVVLGGGPIGLLCAIEAKRYFPTVTIIEKRGGYSRNNVPSLNEPLIMHLDRIGVSKTLWPSGNSGSESIAFSRIEEALWQRARSLGITMERGYVVTSIIGNHMQKNGRYKRINLTLSAWDPATKALAIGGASKQLITDLLVVASGGGASRDNVVVQTLGFTFTKLRAKNYAAYGVFSIPEKGSVELDYSAQSKFARLSNQIVSGKIAFSTKDHNYLLVTLSQCTKTDFEFLQQNADAFHVLLLAVSEGYQTSILQEIKEVEKNTGLFKVSIQRARHFCSSSYPAVIVGDAAVTPHPESGSGMVTGFAGVEQLSLLFKALQGTNRSSDNSASWLSFEQCYELFVSKKALEGTRVMLRNLIKLIERFRDDAVAISRQFNNLSVLGWVDEMVNTSDTLREVLKLQDFRAERLLGILNGEPEKFDWKQSGVDQLWADISGAYKAIKQLTSDVGLFRKRVDELESGLVDRGRIAAV